MSTDEINRAIAEHLGWEDCLNGFGTETRYKGTPSEVRVTVPYPRYSEDLNAMHVALQSLTEVELFRYADEVCDLTCDSNHDTDIRTMLMLSAKELAGCFVRAIGKWRDS